LRLVMVTETSDPVRQRVPRATLAGDPTSAAVLDALVGSRLVIADETTVEIALRFHDLWHVSASQYQSGYRRQKLQPWSSNLPTAVVAYLVRVNLRGKRRPWSGGTPTPLAELTVFPSVLGRWCRGRYDDRGVLAMEPDADGLGQVTGADRDAVNDEFRFPAAAGSAGLADDTVAQRVAEDAVVVHERLAPGVDRWVFLGHCPLPFRGFPYWLGSPLLVLS
jgi:hypothetical protein